MAQKNNSKNTVTTIVTWVAVLLTAFGIVMSIVYAGANVPSLRKLIVYIGYAMVIIYGAYGYKKPHGNMLRYVMVIFAFLLVMENYITARNMNLPAEFAVGSSAAKGDVHKDLDILLTGVASLVIAYMAGRLNKFKKNRNLFAFVFVVLVCRCLVVMNDKDLVFANMGDVIMLCVIACAYFLRYSMHKKAGRAESQ